MKIRLLGWESSGLRCPDARVNLAEGGICKVSLIQMPNGTGKTTTLSLLKVALTGRARDWEPDQVMQFARRRDAQPAGKFLVRLSVDDKPLTFELSFDFIEGGIRYRTTSPGAGGVSEGWKPPDDVRRFLTSRFVDLFVFDGELANKMLDPHQSRAEEAIDALCQLDLLDAVRREAELSWQRLTKDKGAKTETGLAMWKSKEKTLAERLNVLKINQKKAQDELTALIKNVSTIEKSIKGRIAEDKTLRDDLQRMELEETRLEGVKDQSAATAMRIIRQPQRLHDSLSRSLSLLKGHLDKAKLPDTTSRQFFVELADTELCVCDRPIGDAEREAILAKAGRYLGNDIAGVLNSLKQDISLLVDTEDPEQQTVSGALTALSKAENDFHKAQTERQGLFEKLVEQSDEEVHKLNEQLKQKEVRKHELEDVLSEMVRQPMDADNDDEKTVCIAAIVKQLDQARKKIADITGTVELKRRIDLIVELTNRAKELARDRIRAELVTQCNSQLSKILVADEVQIAAIQKSISLVGQREASVGQTLAVGYTFLTAVLEKGTHQFPLIVDSPAGPLDDQVRREVGKMIPSLCDQFVAFTISTERSHFLPAIEQYVQKNIRYLTLFRKVSGTKHLLDSLPSEGVNQSENAVLVEGRDYFVKFALAEESEE